MSLAEKQMRPGSEPQGFKKLDVLLGASEE